MILSPQTCQCPLVDEGPSLVNSPICSGYLLFMILLEKYLKGRCDIVRPCKMIKSTTNLREQYDFIVVGSGTAGSIVAGRLSENTNSFVLLIEAGGPAPIGSRVPSFYRTFIYNDLIDWRYRTVPENYCLDQKGKGCMWPRGKVLGGSSVLNGMMYHRGHPADFDDWVKAGATGWSWNENLPYALKYENNKQIGSKYLSQYHSNSGPMPIQQVIVCAGALNSPQILMLSGIGPRVVLEKFGISVVQDLPVGKNLHNHYGITLNVLLTKLNYTDVLDWNVFTQYMLERKGPMSSTASTQVTGLLYSSLAERSKNQPDIQFFFNGQLADCSKDGVIGGYRGCPRVVNASINAAILLPRSIGYLTLNSIDPLSPPLFYPGYFSHPEDLVMIKDAYRYLRRIIETSTFKNKYGLKLDPEYAGSCEKYNVWSDFWMECMARIYTDAQNHQAGTASIGLVVDTTLKVYNIKGLRVIDASVMPTQVTGNPQAAIMMVAERGCEFIKEDYSL